MDEWVFWVIGALIGAVGSFVIKYVIDRQAIRAETEATAYAIEALRSNTAKWDVLLADKIAFDKTYDKAIRQERRSPPYKPTRCDDCGKVMDGIGFIGPDNCVCDQKPPAPKPKPVDSIVQRRRKITFDD